MESTSDPAPYQYKREIVFKKGETIFKQGTFISKIIFIQEGLVKLFIEGTSGKDLIVRFYGQMEYLGLSGVFGKNESKYTAQVLRKTRVCMIEINHFKKMLSKHPSLNEHLFNHINEEHDLLFSRLGILGTKNLQGRLAEAILYLYQISQKENDIYSHITRRDIAELSAMSVESMIRLLNEFKHDKLININGKDIEINNLEMIKILCKAG
ncbi:MAG TPA: Crp/Fnr family transcriptional regulator [Bacteroidales bacterium]|nr:Crp/Fnr family transcriptional regulator [Bacteroidales bacterium]